MRKKHIKISFLTGLKALLAFIAFTGVFLAPLPVSAKGPKARDLREEIDRERYENVVEDYDLVIIEENEVPKAASPAVREKRTAPLVWVAVCLLILFGGGIYIVAFVKYRQRIRVLEKQLSMERRKSLNECSLMFHPVKRTEMADDVENELASRYIE